ncbi:hypothetical protein ACRDNQ_03685 [Palleronia sp. KMU-117]|uniref:hypothetical protein n=1 Tax=Palleronia sp. KMU-117 TaxID=3434108 RepID=UPI003D7172DD
MLTLSRRVAARLAFGLAVLSLPFAAPAQDAVSLSTLPTLADTGPDFCSVLRQQKAAGLTDETRAQLSAELARRGGFNAADRRVLARPGVDVGFGMSLQGLRCALGPQVRVVKVWRYGNRQTWQVELFPDFPRYNIGFAYMQGGLDAASMRVASLI